MESVDTKKITPQYGFSIKKSLMEDKRKHKGAHSSEPQKAHLIGEFVAVTKNGGHALGSMLATVVSEAVTRNFKFWRFFKIPVNNFMFLRCISHEPNGSCRK